MKHKPDTKALQQQIDALRAEIEALKFALTELRQYVRVPNG